MQKWLSIGILSTAIFALSACSDTQEEGAKQGDGYYSEGELIQPEATPGSYEDLVLSVGDRVFFDTDSSRLNAEATRQVEAWAQWLQTYPTVGVTIEGHADERGTREYNYALGDRRANSIKRYLVQLGIDNHRLQTTSFGKDRPEVLGSDEASWAQNRRGVIVFRAK